MSEKTKESPIKQSVGDNIKDVKGDIIFEKVTQIGYQTIIQGEVSFEEVSLKHFESKEFLKDFNLENFKASNLSNSLIKQVITQHIVFLSKDRKIKKSNLARLIAYIIGDNKRCLIKEAVHKSNLGLSLQSELHKSEKPSVFILPDISSKTFGVSLEDIKEIARQKQHYIICTTDESKETWQANGEVSFYENLFDEFQNYKYLVNDLSDEQLVHQWYEKLDPREQLLAIALSFFDNTYGDQFFAAIEQLVEKVWQRRDSSLRALDYCDLKGLYAFFSFSGKSEQEEIIEVTSSRERRLLLKVSWKSHRRQIINALPILVNLVKGSVTYFNYELYGTEERCSKLRQVIGEAISDVGLIASDVKVVEDILLSLAADEDIRVQAVAANALANWRTTDKRYLIQGATNEILTEDCTEPDKRLFEIIQRWQNEAQISSLVNSFLQGADYEKSKEPVDYIRSTIALTVGYASELDPPDQMSEELLRLLKLLINDRNYLVRNRVFSDTLPRIVRRHTDQIKNDLKIFLLEPDLDLIIAISKSLANAYQFRPTVVLSILESWHTEAENSRPVKVPKNKVTSREILLATVAMTYGEIDFLVNHQIFGNLQKILAEEPHPFVRASAISAVGRQAQKNFKQVEPQLQTLAGQVTKDERQALADILTEIYLEQRFRLSGGDDTIKVKDWGSNELLEKEYSVWLNSQRPLTDVEVAMLRWVKDDENAMAQQVATRASIGFADKFDKEEARQVEEIKKKRGIQQVEMFEEYALPIQAGYPPRDWYLGKLIPWLVTKSAENYRISIRNLLPEGLFQRRQSRENINFVLHKWHDSSDSDIKIISDRLKPGILLAENLKWGMVGAALISIGLVSSSVNRLQKIPSPELSVLSPESSVLIDPGIALSDSVGVNDIDSQTFDQGQLIIRFAENGTPEDRLSIRSQGRGEAYINLSGNKIFYGNEFVGQFVGGKGAEPLVVNFNSNAKSEAVQALMRNVTYHNVVDSPKLGLRKVEFQVTDDAGATSNSLVRNILVAQENKPPQLKIPNNQTANENTALEISGIGFEDSDSTKKITIVLSTDQGTITVLDSVPKGIRAENIRNNNSKEVTLTGNAEQINSTLSAPNSVMYQVSNNTKFSIKIDDGGLDIPGETNEVLIWPPNSQTAKTNQGSFQITVNPTNKIPRISITEPQKVVDEDKKLPIGNIVIDDPDSSNLVVVLSVENGTLNVKSNVSQGLTQNEISANQSNRVVLSGERNKVRATLSDSQSIIYQGRENFYGSDLLRIEVNDGGRGNSGTIAINVNPVNDPPVLSVLQDIAPAKTSPSQSSPPSVPAQRAEITNATIAGDPSQQKNIRAGITIDTEVLFELPVGSRVRVIDSRRNSDNYLWYKIYSPQYRREGWIASHLIQLD